MENQEKRLLERTSPLIFDQIIKDIFKNRQKDGSFKKTETHGYTISCNVIPVGTTDWSSYAKSNCKHCWGKGYQNVFFNINKYNLSWTTGVTKNSECYIITPQLFNELVKEVGQPIKDKNGNETGEFVSDTCKIRTVCHCAEKKMIQKNPHWYLNTRRTECYQILYQRISEEEKLLIEKPEEFPCMTPVPADKTAVIQDAEFEEVVEAKDGDK